MATVTYTTQEVCDAAGVSYRQLDYWTRLELVGPGSAGANGTGSVRRWLPRQVATVAVVGLVQRTYPGPVDRLTRLVEFLDDLPLRRWQDTRILLDPDGQVWLLGDFAASLLPAVGTYIDLSLALTALL